MQTFPVVAAQAIDQQVAVAQARKAARLGPGFGQPRGNANVLAAIAQDFGTDARDFRPIGFFQVYDPIALV
ncbi:hypothetical protein D3C80_2133810 [compost metagenome]